MVSYGRQIHVEKGEFLEFACAEGNSPVDLEQAIAKYSKQGNYRIDFRLIAADLEWGLIMGVYENPTVGCLMVSYHRRDNHHRISGKSYGEGIADVMQDYLDVIGLVPTTSPDTDVLAMREGLRMFEAKLRLVPDESVRKQILLEVIKSLQRCKP